MHMNIGFIGAGKVGFSLGKYLTERNEYVTGYYSRSPKSALEAAQFTDSRQYLDLQHLVADSDAVFITVPDGEIASVWEQIKTFPIENKIISHFSGAMSSAVFSDIERSRAYGFSIHPLIAVNSKYDSWRDLTSAFWTIEGHEEKLETVRSLFTGPGNTVAVISAQNKIRYHACAAMASNLYVGLVNLCEDMLRGCGFTASDAHMALSPLIHGNTENIVNNGTIAALTGPIERNDLETVMKHRNNLTEEEDEVYRVLSKQVLKTAKLKHPEREYQEMEGVLSK